MLNSLKNDRFIKVLLKQPVDRTPVWIMRQAGRYLPEYRKIRKKVPNFMDLCKNPELACEVTLQPLKRFNLDAAILFSDILTIPDAMNLGLSFEPNIGPLFKNPVSNQKDIEKLPELDPLESMGYVYETIRLIKHELNNKAPLIGFAGSPWTVATYMVEGGSSKSFNKIRKLIYSQPKLAEQLLEKLTINTCYYLEKQVEAGVDALMIFDTWGGLLGGQQFESFSLNYLKKIVAFLKSSHISANTPIILYSKAGLPYLPKIADSGCNAVGLDWTVDLKDARNLIGNKVALQGNMDPAVLYGTKASIRAEVARILDNYGDGAGHIFNLGHGILPDINPDNVSILIDAIHELSPSYH